MEKRPSFFIKDILGGEKEADHDNWYSDEDEDQVSQGSVKLLLDFGGNIIYYLNCMLVGQL